MKKKILTVATGDPPTLAELLAARLREPVDVTRGGVQLNGKRVLDGATPVSPGMRLVVHLDPPEILQPRVVWEDDWILVADKPAGMPSQATRGDSAGALDAWAQARNPDARLVHRLDRDASGLILLSLSPEARGPLGAALDGGRIERRYLALVRGALDDGEINLRIARDSNDERRRQALPENDPNGQPARSHHRAVEKRGDQTLVELTLDTGRTHQLRVHLAAIGHPIAGDTLYGGEPAARLMLHAHSLMMRHPRNRRPLSFDAPAPFA